VKSIKMESLTDSEPCNNSLIDSRRTDISCTTETILLLNLIVLAFVNGSSKTKVTDNDLNLLRKCFDVIHND